jgi:hypothetical protein
MAYAKLVTVGHYKVCRHIDTGCLYVAGYDPETRKSFYRSLRTNDLESAVVATRSLVDRHVTGDPKAFLNLKPIRAVRELLECRFAPRCAATSKRFATDAWQTKTSH